MQYPGYISRIHFPVTTLGPGQRVGIWLQGCSIRCEGCISADTWAEGKGGGVDTNEIINVTRVLSLFNCKTDS